MRTRVAIRVDGSLLVVIRRSGGAVLFAVVRFVVKVVEVRNGLLRNVETTTKRVSSQGVLQKGLRLWPRLLGQVRLWIVFTFIDKLTANVEALCTGHLHHREDLVDGVEGCHLAAHCPPRLWAELRPGKVLFVVLSIRSVRLTVRRWWWRRWDVVITTTVLLLLLWRVVGRVIAAIASPAVGSIALVVAGVVARTVTVNDKEGKAEEGSVQQGKMPLQLRTRETGMLIGFGRGPWKVTEGTISVWLQLLLIAIFQVRVLCSV